MTGERIVVSGMGALAPNGVGADAFWQGTRNGRSGIKSIAPIATARNRVGIGGHIPGLEQMPFAHRCSPALYDRVSRLMKMAADEALASARLPEADLRDRRLGIIVGVAMGGMASLDRCYEDYHVQRTGITTNEFIASMPNSPSALLSIEYGAGHLNYTLNTACSSSSAAIGLAYSLLRQGALDVCLTGGAEAPLTPVVINNFDKLKLLNSKSNDQPERASMPFCLYRNGLVLAEGAGMLVLEREAHLLARGGSRMCEVIGYGAGSDAAHIVAPDADGQARTIRAALADAGIRPADVDYIHAHGTSTRLNDAVETRAIKAAYGSHAHRIPISSVKSMIGHTLGASGALSVICTVKALADGFLPPTINLDASDPDCDLDYVANVGRGVAADVAVVHAFGFGGNNQVLVLRR